MSQTPVCCLLYYGLDPEDRGDMLIRNVGLQSNGLYYVMLRMIELSITNAVRTSSSFRFTWPFQNSPVADCSGLCAASSSTIETRIAMQSHILFIPQRKVLPLPPTTTAKVAARVAEWLISLVSNAEVRRDLASRAGLFPTPLSLLYSFRVPTWRFQILLFLTLWTINE